MEKLLTPTSLLVSETDERGMIRYANEDFCSFAEYEVSELEGKPHNIVRHPDMPSAAFKGLWESVNRGEIWRGFVKNTTKNGNFYWVYTTVFPYINSNGEKGFLSVRKMATADETQKYEKLYQEMNTLAA
jgi:aerotaxis receptor